MISTCPVCAAEVPAQLRGTGTAVWSCCWNCEAQFQVTRPAPAAGHTGAGSGLPPARWAPAPDSQIATVLTRCKLYRREGRLLDVGFGEGQIMSAAAAEGWQCWGTETSQAALDAGRRNGWRVLGGDLCRIGLPGALFDVICMAHVLEYLEQPAAYLREAIRLLRPGGLLFLATTSTHATESLPQAHWQCYLQLFTTTAVRLALETAGYTRERISVEAAQTSPRSRPTEGLPPGQADLPSSSQLLGAALQQFFRAYPAGEQLTAFAERPR